MPDLNLLPPSGVDQEAEANPEVTPLVNSGTDEMRKSIWRIRPIGAYPGPRFFIALTIFGIILICFAYGLFRLYRLRRRLLSSVPSAPRKPDP
jgi:hypothetical protein